MKRKKINRPTIAGRISRLGDFANTVIICGINHSIKKATRVIENHMRQRWPRIEKAELKYS